MLHTVLGRKGHGRRLVILLQALVEQAQMADGGQVLNALRNSGGGVGGA